MPLFSIDPSDARATAKQRRIVLILGAVAMLALIAGLVSQNQTLRGFGLGLAIVWAVACTPLLKKRA